MAGSEGVLLLNKKNGLRVILTLDLIMQSIAVEVDACDLEPAVPPARHIHPVPGNSIESIST